VCYGAVEGSQIVEIQGDIFGKFRLTSQRHELSEVKLLAPTKPRTCIGGPGVNYRSHLEFASRMTGRPVEVPALPTPWRKGENCIIGPDEAIVIPKDSTGDVHPEGELVVVIGKQCRRATEANAMEFVFGYTCGNDVSERNWQRKDFDFWRAKGCDTFGPVGPWIATDVDPNNLELEVRLNGKVVQKGNTSEFIHGIPSIIKTVSQAITLLPGDLIFTGTPGSTEAMKPGDIVEVELSGIGVLRNPVVAEK
jgi:2-keto-4-pentenoate hydratase/2-oxohepta-3-ene-1,7-dioic acid hydratase in catechol pathway